MKTFLQTIPALLFRRGPELALLSILLVRLNSLTPLGVREKQCLYIYRYSSILRFLSVSLSSLATSFQFFNATLSQGATQSRLPGTLRNAFENYFVADGDT